MPKKNRPKNIRQTLKRLFVYFKPFRIRFAFVVLFVILSCGANVAGIYFLKPLINDYIAPYIGQKKSRFIEFYQYHFNDGQHLWNWNYFNLLIQSFNDDHFFTNS